MSEEPLPAISIVTVSHNGRKSLGQLLPLLVKMTEAAVDIVVVDNASTDGTSSWLRKEFSTLRVVTLSTFAERGEALMQGFAATRGPFVAFVDCDVKVSRGWLAPLLAVFDHNPALGAACAQLRFMQAPDTVQADGGGMTWLGLAYPCLAGVAVPPPEAHVTPDVEVLLPTAGVTLVSRSAFERIGGFDPMMTEGYEWVDLGLRLWQSDYEIRVCRRSVVYHQTRDTIRQLSGSPLSGGGYFRQAVRCMLKCYRPLRAAKALLAMTGLLLLRLRWGTLLHCVVWNVWRIKSTLQARRELLMHAPRSEGELLRAGLILKKHLPPSRSCCLVRAAGWRQARILHGRVLDPARPSAAARLGPGWGCVVEGASSVRSVHGSANAILRVGADSAGELRVVWRAPEGERQMTLVCNGERVKVAAGLEWTTSRVRTKADANGLLEFWLGAATLEPNHFEVRHIAFYPEAPAPEGVTTSMIVTTSGSSELMPRILTSIEHQRQPPDEVVVVHDGTDPVLLAFLSQWCQTIHPFETKLVAQRRPGPAAARNAGIEAAECDWIIFLGEDMIAEPGMVSRHVEQHNLLGPGCAVVGMVKWDPALALTPFLRFAVSHGSLFSFKSMPDGGEVPFNCFYTANLSIARQVLAANTFDEEFKHAGREDVELGYRLVMKGLRLVHTKLAKVAYAREIDIVGLLRRHYIVGRATRFMVSRHPELSRRFAAEDAWWFSLCRGFGGILRLFVPLIAWFDRKGIRLPRWLYSALLLWYYAKGFSVSARRLLHSQTAL